MIIGTGLDTPGQTVIPELTPGLLRQTGPHAGQMEVVFPGEYPVGGPDLPVGDLPLNRETGQRPAHGLED